MKLIASLVLVVGLFGCNRTDDTSLRPDQKLVIEDAIKDRLKDPDSAKFRWDQSMLDASPNGYGEACVYINAKNGFGGYTGYKITYVSFFHFKNKVENIVMIGMGDSRTVANCSQLKSKIRKFKSHDSRLTDDQVRAGCSFLDGKLFCASPGTGMCWEKGHSPWKGESPARAIDIGNSPSSPDYDHVERCD